MLKEPFYLIIEYRIFLSNVPVSVLIEEVSFQGQTTPDDQSPVVKKNKKMGIFQLLAKSDLGQ